MITQKTQKVGREYIHYTSAGNISDPAILLMHGLGLGPDYYKEIIEGLARKGNLVVAPAMYFVNYLNRQPGSIAEYAEATADFVKSLQLGTHSVVGHSLGSTVSFRYATISDDVQAVVSMAPILPRPRGVPKLICDMIGAVSMASAVLKPLLGFYGPKGKIIAKKAVPDFIANCRKAGKSGKRLFKDIDMGYRGIYVRQPTLIIAGSKDESTRLSDKKIEEIRPFFAQLETIVLEGRNHDWPFYEPGTAISQSHQYISNIRRLQKENSLQTDFSSR